MRLPALFTTRKTAGPDVPPGGLTQLIRRLIVYGASLVFDFSTLILLVEKLNVFYLEAATASFIFGVIFRFYLNLWWVEKVEKPGDRHHPEYAIYAVMCALGLAINIMVIAAGVEFFGWDYRLGKAIATVLVVAWNYWVRKTIFNQPQT